MAESQLRCTRCGEAYPLADARWECECGGPLEVRAEAAFPIDKIVMRPPRLWRFREAIALAPGAERITLGEGMTPLLRGHCGGLEARFKAEYLMPTGSFKDRGTVVMVSQIRALGIRQVVEDSSGNAGASVAAYCGRAGIQCEVYVPASASPGKLTQIRAYGAKLVRVPGSREDTTAAVVEATRHTFYASHNRHPFFIEGVKTYAYELWEQLGWRAPDNVVVPAGSASLVVAGAIGFRDLLAAGAIEQRPRLFAVQAEACAPLVHAWRQGLPEAAPVEKAPTAAEGIVITRPFRDREALAAVRETGGAMIAVSEPEIWAALRDLGAQGIYVEPTSAVAAAGVGRLVAEGRIQPGETTVVVLTGSGLKATELIGAGLALS